MVQDLKPQVEEMSQANVETAGHEQKAKHHVSLKKGLRKNGWKDASRKKKPKIQ